MYRIYVGEYVKEGLPNTWTLVHISKIYPSGILNKLNENIKYGMDIYITKNGKIISKLTNPFQERIDIAKSLFPL